MEGHQYGPTPPSVAILEMLLRHYTTQPFPQLQASRGAAVQLLVLHALLPHGHALTRAIARHRRARKRSSPWKPMLSGMPCQCLLHFGLLGPQFWMRSTSHSPTLAPGQQAPPQVESHLFAVTSSAALLQYMSQTSLYWYPHQGCFQSLCFPSQDQTNPPLRQRWSVAAGSYYG